jgi:hypothetical protein
MNIIWSDFDADSEWSVKQREAKQVNGPEYWPTMREVFKHDCATLPLNRFRLWASIHNVPLVTQYRTSRFFGEAFYHAYRDSEIYEALVENWIGIPEAMAGALRPTNDFDTSTQRIQNLGHLMITGFGKEKLRSIKSIVEIGAGYGDMCSLIHDLGFQGEYTIVDIPETQPVQEFYLGKQGITPKWSFEDDNVTHADLVIATWSLSETPLEYRAQLMPKIDQSKNWLIMAQSEVFGQKVNDEYFTDFFKDKNLTKIPLGSEDMKQWDGDNNYYVVRD